MGKARCKKARYIFVRWLWLQGLKLRDVSLTPVVRAILDTSRGGIKLQIWRKMLNWDRVWFFIRALWRGYRVNPALFLAEAVGPLRPKQYKYKNLQIYPYETCAKDCQKPKRNEVLLAADSSPNAASGL